MTNLKIASFNIRNKNTKEEKLKNINILVDIIKNEKIDILGTQELTSIYEKELNKKLNDYKCYGNYRFGKMLKNNKFNENNIIITNQKVIFNKTVWLPWISKNINDLKTSIIKKSIMPRIATTIIIDNEEIGKIKVINTHLDHKVANIKKKQLEKIKKIIIKSKNKYPTILTGDFNLQPGNEILENFILELEKCNMRKVEINDSTWSNQKGKERIIDHIFIPKSWKIINKGIIDNQGISDHNPIFVSVEIPKKEKFKDKLNILKKKLKLK